MAVDNGYLTTTVGRTSTSAFGSAAAEASQAARLEGHAHREPWNDPWALDWATMQEDTDEAMMLVKRSATLVGVREEEAARGPAQPVKVMSDAELDGASPEELREKIRQLERELMNERHGRDRVTRTVTQEVESRVRKEMDTEFAYREASLKKEHAQVESKLKAEAISAAVAKLSSAEKPVKKGQARPLKNDIDFWGAEMEEAFTAVAMVQGELWDLEEIAASTIARARIIA